MTLEFEQLNPALDRMAEELGQRQGWQEIRLEQLLQALNENATAWAEISEKIERVISITDEKYYRAAVPLHHSRPLNQGIPPTDPPQTATIVACDGSQIVPDRHAPFLYYLINVGIIAYYHGSRLPPDVQSLPTLKYPGTEEFEEDDQFSLSSALVNLRRDRKEIESLALTLESLRPHPGPRLAILDQRLLYWPASGLPGREGPRVVEAWQQAMTRIRKLGASLAGYIDRPGKRSVLTMLDSLKIDHPHFRPAELYLSTHFAGLSDVDLYELILKSGERSPVFVEISQHNNAFRASDKENEVCFFYLRTGEGSRVLARVDIPMWVARDESQVSDIHALIYDQCQILGSYPYVITRADEIAVVTRRDQEELENRIALRLADLGIGVSMTAKQQSKELARSSKTRHEGF
ncbi:MAG: DNA double-strand break repair nuclease NurA [Candidatus Promineifilaceae bacterium]|nr:DNA double-strand break repair nuclease NurA [Candidatus Promineifilaceae bacterium]